MAFYEKGNVRIRYEQAGTGFPLLLIPGGGLNSRLGHWRVLNAPELFKDDFRLSLIHVVAGAPRAHEQAVHHA
jgi:pimeloyl-ACP methyl ester carboxylesterase